MLKARLARFYGWTDREIGRMSQVKAMTYFKCIEPLMAEETLTNLTVSAFPNMKREKAKKLEKEVRKRTKVNFSNDTGPMSTEEMYRHLVRTLGNG